MVWRVLADYRVCVGGGDGEHQGLWYPVVVAVMSLVIGSLFLRETKDVDISK